MASEYWYEPTRRISLRIRNHVVVCAAAAVCSLTAASAFLLHAVLLETTGQMDYDMRRFGYAGVDTSERA
jgi:hypothetical protein